MAHGYSAVKEMYLERFAEVFAEAGVGAVVVFDNRNFGASDGEPRQEIDPWQQLRDYRDAITCASDLPEVDAERIGIWGLKLQRRPCARGRRHRPAGQVGRCSGAVDQRARERAAADPRGFHRPGPGGVP